MTKREAKKKTHNAKLYVRIFPSTDICSDSIKLENNRQVLYVRCLQDLSKGANVKNANYWSFRTDGVFWNSSQAEIFDVLTSDWYDDVFNGVSGTILSYGQTGCGKTFTTSGLRLQYQNRGLILRILSRLFFEKQQRQDITSITFGMSYLEFSGETLRDLIADEAIQKIKDVTEHHVPNEEWAWKQVFNAECRKSYAEEAPYQGSNRGHSVLTFFIHAESLIDTDPVVTHSKIHVVDMAGIGNLSQQSTWKNKFDVEHSNVSKTLMEQLITCLTGGTWKAEGHICPYKSNRLLVYLHDTLQPNCLVRFVAHIYGNRENLPVTISTLKFGEKIKAFKPMKLERLVESNCVLKMRNLEKECQRLKGEIELNEMLNNSSGYCCLSQERIQQIKRAAEEFLMGQLENLSLISFGQGAITLEVFKNLYHKLSNEKDQKIKDAVAAAAEMLQNQLALEKNLNSPSPVVPNLQRMSRKKSRQQESQVAFGASFRSSDSSQLTLGKGSSVVQATGVTDRRGISIGPGKPTTTTFEGNITKAFKKLKTRRSDNLIIKTGRALTAKDINVVSVSKNAASEDPTDIPLPQSIPSRESAWKNFFSENPHMVNFLRSVIDNQEEVVKIAKKKYVATLTDLTELKEDIRELRVELEDCKHTCRVYGREEFAEDGDRVPGETEKELEECLARKECQLNTCIENSHAALIDLQTALAELNEAKKALEEAFQDHCKANFKMVLLPEEITLPDITSDPLTGAESPCESDFKTQNLMALYSRLQKKLFNYVSFYFPFSIS